MPSANIAPRTSRAPPTSIRMAGAAGRSGWGAAVAGGRLLRSSHGGHGGGAPGGDRPRIRLRHAGFSAGLLLHRRAGDVMEVLIGHPGGPFWARRTTGHGRSPREYRRARIRGRPPAVNSPRNWAAPHRMDRAGTSARQTAQRQDVDGVRGRRGPRSQQLPAATRSPWNGRKARAMLREFPSWTGRLAARLSLAAKLPGGPPVFLDRLMALSS